MQQAQLKQTLYIPLLNDTCESKEVSTGRSVCRSFSHSFLYQIATIATPATLYPSFTGGRDSVLVKNMKRLNDSDRTLTKNSSERNARRAPLRQPKDFRDCAHNQRRTAHDLAQRKSIKGPKHNGTEPTMGRARGRSARPVWCEALSFLWNRRNII